MRRALPSLQRLRALEAVARLGGFSAAAEEMLLTQSAVSNQIRLLEDELGVPLIERLGKQAKPTAGGRLLLATTKRIIGELEATMQHLADTRGEITGRFVVGGGGTASTYHLPALLARFADAHPKAEVNLHTGHAAELVHGLLDGAIDIIVTSGIPADARLVREFFAEDRLVCIVPPDDPTTLGKITPRDLDGRRLVLFEKGFPLRDPVDAWLAAGAGRGPEAPSPTILDVGLAEAQKSFVMAGFGWSIVPDIAVAREAARGLMRVLPLAPPLSRPLEMAWRRDREANPAIRSMREILKGAGRQ